MQIRTVASHPDGVKPSPEPVVACTQEVDGRYCGGYFFVVVLEFSVK